MFKIGQLKTEISADVEDLQRQFQQKYALNFKDVLDVSLLNTLVQIIDNASFKREEVKNLGYRGLETPPIAGNLLSLMLRRTEFLKWISEISGIEDIDGIDGKIVETSKGPGEELNWHDDLNLSHRKLGMTINLSNTTYDGGDFEMRRKGDTELVFQHHHERIGSMLIFKIAPDLEHRLIPVTDGGPRRVYTGWFVNSAEV